VAVDKDWEVIRIKKLIDTTDYAEDPPQWGSGGRRYYNSGSYVEESKEGSVIRGDTFYRYKCPRFKSLAFKIKSVLIDLLEEDLIESYWFDRFYFSGSSMLPHKDRPACEISVSLHISNTSENDFPLWFESEDGPTSIITDPGDAVIYKGTKVKHWRNVLRGDSVTYYHQVFFHYVRLNGYHVEHAWDAAS
jgi:hypothetical protein